MLSATGTFADIIVVLVNLPPGARPGEQLDVLSCGYWYKRPDDGAWPSYEPPVAEFVPPVPAGAAMLARLTLGCSLLAALNGEDAYFDFVPDAYENGAPKHPSRLYLRVALNAPPDRAVSATLHRLGWVGEDNGQVWLIYG